MPRSLRFVPTELALLVAQPPPAPGWVFEIKYDGYRIESLIEGGRARLLTRRGNNWSARAPGIAARLARLPVESAILDGEIVVLDAKGASRFSLLQQSLDGSRDGDLVYFVFDLLALDGDDLRALPLAERRTRLAALLRRARVTDRGPLRLGQRLEGNGNDLIRAACKLGLEGIIAKREGTPYRGKRNGDWVKIKCGHRQEFVVVGFTPPNGSRPGIGSLLLAVYRDGALEYAGRVGSGIPVETLGALHTRLRRLARDRSPIRGRITGLPAGTVWVSPEVVVEVSFTEWTSDGRLRHPVFQGIREDKPATDVRREEPMPPTTNAAKASGRRRSPARDDAVAGVTITHPDRVIFADAKISKRELAEHFARVAPVMLPHVAGRPLSLVRCPEGVGAPCFFQKHWTGKLPPTLDTVAIEQSDGKKHPYVVVHDAAGLVTLAQWGIVEVHPWGARADAPDRPDRVIFDLDPGPGVTWGAVREATSGLRALLQELGLESWLKTSGGKGLHVELPVARRVTWDDVADFSRAVAERMAAEFPDRFIARASKAARRGVIFVDWLRNTRGATAVAPWSPRARPAAGVSVPVDWSALDSVQSGDAWTIATVAAAPPRRDPWRGMLTCRQAITRRMIERLG